MPLWCYSVSIAMGLGVHGGIRATDRRQRALLYGGIYGLATGLIEPVMSRIPVRIVRVMKQSLTISVPSESNISSPVG